MHIDKNLLSTKVALLIIICCSEFLDTFEANKESEEVSGLYSLKYKAAGPIYSTVISSAVV